MFMLNSTCVHILHLSRPKIHTSLLIPTPFPTPPFQCHGGPTTTTTTTTLPLTTSKMGCIIVKPITTTNDPTSSTPPVSSQRRASSLTLSREKQQQPQRKLQRYSTEIPVGQLRRQLVVDPFGGPTNDHGWPTWLADVVGDDIINGFLPRRATTFEKLDKIGQGTYSNVYKARDLVTGKIVALKKVRFDKLEPEGVKFMAREILILSKLDHPNVIKLQGLVTSRMSSSVYLVFDYMDHDLAGLSSSLGASNFTLPQVKCYMKQLLSGLEHCHNNGVLHRDIKGSNLLIDNEGILKIADFGLAVLYDPNQKKQMTSRVVTLWYRPPELLLGATSYGVGVDLWSAGCILAELLAGKPILPGRTEVEQLHKIFKLCGSPTEECWKKYKLPNTTLYKPQQPYKRCVLETFENFPPSSLPILNELLSIDPEERGTATSALNSEFFSTEPYACEPSSLPKYPPTKELDVKNQDEAVRRQRGLGRKANAADRRVRIRDRPGQGIPAPEANAELQTNLNRLRLVAQANAKSKSEKFPPPHQDGAVGIHVEASDKEPLSFGPEEQSFDASDYDPKLSKPVVSTTPSEGPSRRKKINKETQTSSRWNLRDAWKPSTFGVSMDLMFKGKGSIQQVTNGGK